MAHLFQEHEGYTSPNALAAIAWHLKLPLAVVESTVSFYTMFFRKPVGRYMLQVCRNLSCIINGAEEIMAYFRERLGIGHLETTADGLFSYEEVECLAACDTGKKSPAGWGVSNPNNAGGVGDRSGVIMLDRVVTDPAFAARSNERLVREGNLRPNGAEGGHHEHG
jgi:hypothetical protein